MKHIARFDGREWVVQTRVASVSQSGCGRESMPGIFLVVVLLVVSAASWAQTNQASQTEWPKQVMREFLISHGFQSGQNETYSRQYRNLGEASLDLGFSIDDLQRPLNARNYVPLVKLAPAAKGRRDSKKLDKVCTDGDKVLDTNSAAPNNVQQSRMEDAYRTLTLHGWFFSVATEKGYTLDDPTPCSVRAFLQVREHTYLPPDSSPTIHIKSVSILRKFARPPSITFDVLDPGKTILAFEQYRFRINMMQSSPSRSQRDQFCYGDDYRIVFPDLSPVIIVEPGQTTTLRAEVQGDDLKRFRKSLKKGKWEVRVLFNSGKDFRVVDYQFLGDLRSDNSFEAEVQ
ncbi:MAG TPA: hypothetical protein VK699_08945 [Terriglobales bacterium]|nr:hypothetical protein [Terriglobales bacterium]